MRNSRAYTGLLSATGYDVLLSNGLRLGFLAEDLPALPPSLDRPHGIETNLREDYPELADAWSLLEQSLKAIRDDCAERDIPLLVFAIPSREVVVDALWTSLMNTVDDATRYDRGKALRRVNRICAENAIAFVDLYQAIASHPNPESLYYMMDGHLNPSGATHVAETLAGPIGTILLDGPEE